MSLGSKILRTFSSKPDKEIKAVDIWLVEWYVMKGDSYTDYKREIEAFFNFEDAKEYADRLEDAMKLIRGFGWNKIRVFKQKNL